MHIKCIVAISFTSDKWSRYVTFVNRSSLAENVILCVYKTILFIIWNHWLTRFLPPCLLVKSRPCAIKVLFFCRHGCQLSLPGPIKFANVNHVCGGPTDYSHMAIFEFGARMGCNKVHRSNIFYER